MSSNKCVITECERCSRGLCDCCEQYLCLQHLNEHNQLLVSQLNPLLDDTNQLCNRLNDLILILHGFAISEKKYQEFDHLIFRKTETQKEAIMNLQTKLSQSIHRQETTRDDIKKLQSAVNDLQRSINNIERICMQTINNSTSIDENIIQLRKLCIQEFNPSVFSHVYKIIKPPDKSYRSLAANDQFLLIHQKPELCLLDSQFKIIKYVQWSYGSIHDIIWSSVLEQFVIISANAIYLVNPNTMFVQSIIKNGNERYGSGTCFNDRLFVTTHSWGSPITEIALLPQITIVKKWQSPVTCLADEFIDDIVYDGEALGFLIRNVLKQSIRMELRSIRTLDRLWSLNLDVFFDPTSPYHPCSLDSHEWLIADSSTGRLLQITSDGHLKRTIPYNAGPSRICFFGANKLLITTKTTLNIYKI